MKIAVITAVFGGIDQEFPFPEQDFASDHTVDRFFFNEENNRFPMPSLPNRLKAKFYKCNMNLMCPGYDAYVWIDGNIEVTSSVFISRVMYDLIGHSFVIQPHHERATVGEEYDFIEGSDNPYIKVRYSWQPMKEERAYLNADEAPLKSCNIFAYKCDKYVFDMMRDWWGICLAYTWFDQCALSALLHKYNVGSGLNLGGVLSSQYHTLHPHKEWCM